MVKSTSRYGLALDPIVNHVMTHAEPFSNIFDRQLMWLFLVRWWNLMFVTNPRDARTRETERVNDFETTTCRI